MTRDLLRKQRVACDFDEFQADVLHNRLVKSTLLGLARVGTLPWVRRKELHALAQRMAGVAVIEVRAESFRRVRLHRNNAHYAFALAVCELVHRHLLPTQVAAEWRIHDFRGSDQEMGRLFEQFVRNFIRREIPEVHHPRRSYSWDAEAVGGSPMGLLPRLETDIPLRLGDRGLIVECKFTGHPIATNQWGGKSLRSQHLNQLFVYLSNVEPHWDPPPAGLLLYATVDQELDCHYRLCGRELLVRTLNLAQPWHAIHRDLVELVAGALTRTPPDLRSASPARASVTRA